MNPSLVALTIVGALCLAFSALVTAVESAHLSRRQQTGEPSEAPGPLLYALAIVDLAADLGAAAVAALALLHVNHDPSPLEWTALVLVVTLVLLIPCEVVPRQLGAVDPQRTLRRWGPWVRPSIAVVRPFAAALARLSEGLQRIVAGSLRAARLTAEDVRSAVTTVDQHLELESEERDMVHSIFTFGRR